jgi:hypothetical protein
MHFDSRQYHGHPKSYKAPASVAGSNCKIKLGAANQIPDDSVLALTTGTVGFGGSNDTVKSLSSTGGEP